MKRWLVPVLLLVAVAWGLRHFSNAPPPSLPEVVWTPAPFRGPAVAREPRDDARLEAALGALTPDPPVEALPTLEPDPRVCVVPQARWDRRIATYLGWRTPVPTPADATPDDAALWGARWYDRTGTVRSVGAVRWAEYRRGPAPGAVPPVSPTAPGGGSRR